MVETKIKEERDMKMWHLMVIGGVLIGGAIAAYSLAAYVVAHFILKFW
jgi:hypothetical protein